MTGLNHAATGTVIAVAIKQPGLALPLAFLSHFATDAIPHWNYHIYGKVRHRVMYLDALVTVVLPVIAAEYLNRSLWLILTAALLAVSPDIMWLPNIVLGKPSPKHKKTLLHSLRRFHKRIQTSETDAGLYYEAVWLSSMLVTIFIFKK